MTLCQPPTPGPSDGADDQGEPKTRIVLITRAGCHLCETAERVLDGIGEPWTAIDVDGSVELQRDYGDRVPVVLLDGREHGYWRIDEQRLRRDLARPPGAPPW